MKIEHEGVEMEVYTADEAKAQADAAAAAVRGEFEPKVTELTGKLTAAEAAAAARAGEFKQFRELNADQLAKLSEAERTIYNNGLVLEEERKARATDAEKNQKAAIANAITTRVGENPKLVEKINEMWPLVTIDATTPEQIEQKLSMVLGAISTTTPDLVATLNGFGGGTYTPPGEQKKDGESFADSDAGKELGKMLGATLEAPK